MTATEKLLVQIFERRNSIIEHVKQQTELYSQHLASKLLIDGITPPSWLWNPNSSASDEKDSNELNKEELITKLLRPYQQPPQYPLYDNVVFRGDNEEFSDGFFMENRAFSGKDHSLVPPLSSEDQAGCDLNCVPEPEPDTSVTSPEDQPDERVVNIYNATDQSLSRIQRSKSRQKALQLRSSGRAVARSGAASKNIQDASSSHIKFSLSATHWAGQNEKLLKSAEPCVYGSQSCAERDEKADSRIKEKEKNASTCRITSPRSHVEVPDFVRGPLTLGCSSEEYEENAASHKISEVRRTQSMHISDPQNADDNYDNKWSKSTGPTATLYCQSCGDTQVHGADSVNKRTNVFTDRITRSMPSDDDLRIDTVMMDFKDDLPPDSVYGSPFNPSNAPIEGRDSRESLSNDCRSHKSMVSVPSCSSNQQNAGLDGGFDVEICSHSAKADGGILVLSGKSAQEVNDSKEFHGFVKPSAGLLGTMSPTQSRDRELYKPVAYNEDVSDLEICSHSARADGEILASTGKSTQEDIDSKEVHGSVKPSAGLVGAMSPTQSRDKELYEPVAYNEDDSDLEICSHSARAGGEILASTGKSTQEDIDSKEVHGSVKPSAGLLGAMSPTHSRDKKLYEPVAYNEEVSDLGICSHSARADGDILASSGKSTQEVNDSKEVHGSVKPSAGLLGAMSPTQSHDKELYEPHSARADGDILASSGKSTQEVNDSNEVHGFDKLYDGLFRRVTMSPTQSNGKELYENQAEESGPVIIGAVLSNSENETEVGQNQKISEVSCEADSNLSKMVDMPDIQIHPTKLDMEDGLEASPKLHMDEGDWSGEEKNKSRLVLSTPASENFRTSKDMSQLMSCAPSPGSENLRDSHAYNSAKEPRTEFCDSLIENVGMLNQICGAQQSQSSSCLQGGVCSEHRNSPFRDESSSLGRRFRHASMESWPQLKKRKIDHNKTLCSTTSPSFRAIKLQSTQREPASAYLTNMETKIDSDVDTFHVDKHTDIEIPTAMTSHLVEGDQLTFSSQNREVELSFKEKKEHESLSSFINNEQLGSALVSSLKKDSMDSQGCFIEEISNTNSISSHFDASELGDGHRSQHLCNLEKDFDNISSANPHLTNTMLEGIQQTPYSVPSPRTEDLELIDVDQSMPELEGFIVDAQKDSGVLNYAEDGIDFEKLTLPSNTIERASMLAEICRSASLDTPSYHFSSAFGFQKKQNLYQSVPNGPLDDLDISSSLSLNSDVGDQFQFGRSCVNDCNQALGRTPFSVSPAYDGERYGWNLRSQYTSPVGKLWERLSSHAGSSGKRLSSNPELTCFPIEEDGSISEGNKTVDENEDDAQEVDSSLAKHNDERKPLKDLSNLGFKPSISASSHETTTDFVRKELSVTGAHDFVPHGAENQYRNKSDTSENQTSYIGATDGRKNHFSLHGTNGIKKAKESINGSISKSSLSIKTRLKRPDQKLSLKDSKRTNIISNVSSFIPLIQQKQAATICAGKRDVKVKALGAAEAAKRLEEKKENERKMKKEALKLERAKLEEKNLRQLELEKQKKEDERKKKDADIIAKKRQREEEERKEKEKKRMRLEARHRQRGQEEKNRAGKAEKENRWPKDEQMNRKKELLNEAKNQHNREIVRGDDVALRKADTILTTTEVVINYEECGSSGQSCEVGKAMHAVDISPRNEDLIAHNSKGKTYEISPYHCSDDDEEEEDDELPTKKYIPSWASKSSVALVLPLQQEMDPDTIFPPGSFFSMDEVLLPGKLQQKQMAA